MCSLPKFLYESQLSVLNGPGCLMLLIPLQLSLELVAWELCPVCSLVQDVHQAACNLSFCCCQMLCLVSPAQMNMGFDLKYHRNLYFPVWSFKVFMWAAWAYGCGTKACVSLADMNARWATATVTMISAIKYKKLSCHGRLWWKSELS